MKKNIQHIAFSVLNKLSWLFVFVFVFQIIEVRSQELEPRMLSNVPTGTNFFGLGYTYATGNMMLDPALPIENLQAKVNTLVSSYVHAFSFFGKSAKINLKLPWAYGNWDGYFEGVDTPLGVWEWAIREFYSL